MQLIREFATERDGEKVPNRAERRVVARRSDGNGGMEAHGVELEADSVDEATHGAIFFELRGVDVEKLEKNVEKRVNRTRNGLDRPYDQRKRKNRTDGERRKHEKENKRKQRGLKHRELNQLNRMR